MIKNSKGLLKVFISSTFRDLKEERERVYETLSQSLTPIGMEFFIPDGRTSHEISLLDENEGLKNSDIIIFLISPYYGSFIDECKIPGCKAECPLKEGSGKKISYTHCEYKFAKAENKPFLIYLFDEEAWRLVKPLYQMEKIDWDKNELIFEKMKVEEIKKLFAAKQYIKEFQQEIESDFCPRIEKTTIHLISEHLSENIIKWYHEGRIQFQGFCGRKNELKRLLEKMNESVEVYGVGGIGKTTLVHIALLIQLLKGRSIIAIGKKQSYLSGSGYNFFKEKCKNIIFEVTTNTITINDIIDSLNFREVQIIESIDDKIHLILNKIEKENYLIFIDDFHLADNNVRLLVKQSNNFVISSKKSNGITRAEIPIYGIDKSERLQLIELISDRFGRNLSPIAKIKISDFSEGHPITMEILIRNFEKINFEKLEDYKKDALDFSNHEQVEEFINRVIEEILSKEAYILLKNLSILNTEVESNINFRIVEKTYKIPTITNVFFELVDSGIFQKRASKEGVYQFSFKHIQDAVRCDDVSTNRLAVGYYDQKIQWIESNVDDEIERFSHQLKYPNNIHKANVLKKLYSSCSPSNYGFKRLVEICFSLKDQVNGEEKAYLCLILGSLLSDLNRYRDAKEASEESLAIYKSLSERNRDYIELVNIVLNSLGNLYIKINKYDTAKEYYEQSLEISREINKRKKNSQVEFISVLLSNLGIVYTRLNRPIEAESAFLEALKIRKNLSKQNKIKQFSPISKVYNNLAALYLHLHDYPKALQAYKDSIKIKKSLAERNPVQNQLQYATALMSIGSLYYIINNEDKSKENLEKSLEYLRELVETNSDAYLPYYVNAVLELAIFSMKINCLYDAKDYLENALKNSQILSKICPNAHNPTLAGILAVSGNLYINFNRPDLSLPFFNNAYTIYTDLDEKSPGIYVESISEAIRNIGLGFLRLNKFSQAESMFQQCLSLRKELVDLCYDAFIFQYSEVLFEISYTYESLKKFDLQEKLLDECIVNFKMLNEKCPSAYKSNLLDSLLLKCKMLAIRRDNRFIQLSNDSAKYADDLVKISRNIYLPTLGNTYNTIGYCYMVNDDFDIAKKFYLNALDIQKELVINSPDAFNPLYSIMLNNLGCCYNLQNEPSLGEKLFNEALIIQKELINNCADAFNPDYADTLNNLGYCKLLQEKCKENFDSAETHLTESLNIYQNLVITNYEAFNDKLAIVLRNLGYLYHLSGRNPESKKSFEEALLIQKKNAINHPKIFKKDYLDTLKRYLELQITMNSNEEISIVKKLIKEQENGN
jgi:tetratricopeptide (TPR) repeat protein